LSTFVVVAGGPLLLTLSNSRSNIDNEKSNPEPKNPRTTIWILAILATNPIIVRTKRIDITTRTKGMRIIPPPGCMISCINDAILNISSNFLKSSVFRLFSFSGWSWGEPARKGRRRRRRKWTTTRRINILLFAIYQPFGFVNENNATTT